MLEKGIEFDIREVGTCSLLRVLNFEGIIILCVFTYKYFGTFCVFVVSYVKRK